MAKKIINKLEGMLGFASMVFGGSILNKALEDENHLYGVLASTILVGGYKLWNNAIEKSRTKKYHKSYSLNFF